MNILLISHFFPPHKGGVETASYNTAKKLTEMNHKVVVLTSKCEGATQKFQRSEGFLIYRFRSFYPSEIKILPQVSSLGFMPMAIIKLPKIIRKHRIQLIHVEGRLFPISVISALLNRIIFKKPFVVSVQGRLEVGLTGEIENIFDKIITRHVYKKVKKIICVSESLRERLINFKISKDLLTVIPNGVDISVFNRIESSKMLDQYLNNKENYKKIVFVGRLDTQKGVEYLIKAIPQVIQKFDKVHFFILGNGNLEAELKRLTKSLKIQSYTTFIDMIPLEKMPEFYSSADIFCLPSLHEGFPLSIAEALSIGLIIVASATEGIPEAIIENENGFLVEPKNVNQLTEKLLKALKLNQEEIERMSKNNIELAKNTYSWKILVKQIEDVYKSNKKILIRKKL